MLFPLLRRSFRGSDGVPFAELDPAEAAFALALGRGQWEDVRTATLLLRDRVRDRVGPEEAARRWAALAHGVVALDPQGAQQVTVEAQRRCEQHLPEAATEMGDLLALLGHRAPSGAASLLATVAEISHADDSSLAAVIAGALVALDTAEPSARAIARRWVEIALSLRGLVPLSPWAGSVVVFDTLEATISVGATTPVPFARSRRRFELLFAVAVEPSLTREQLFERVWGHPWQGDASKNALHATVSRARSAVELELEPNPSRGYQLQGDWLILRKGPERRSAMEDSGFIGRDAEFKELRQHLETHRVVCVFGPPGSGKSRLVAEVARRWGGRVIRVDLRGVEEVSEITLRVGRRLGCVPADLERALRQEPNTLLVLDDLDELTEQGAASLGETLRGWVHPGTLTVAATRREKLPSAENLRLDPMEPEDAVALLQRFAPDGERGELAALARRLDHLPLAMELAGEHLMHISPSVLMGLIPEVLASGPVVQALELSWSRLSDAQQRAMCRLGVITATLPPIAAGSLVSSSELEDLVGRGLVQRDRGHVSLLRSIQQFVQPHLEGGTRREVLGILLDWADCVPMERFSTDLEAIFEVQMASMGDHPRRAAALALDLSWRLQGFAAPADVLAMVDHAVRESGEATPTLQLAEATARFSASQFEQGTAILPDLADLGEPVLRQTATLLRAKLGRVRRVEHARELLDQAVDQCVGDRLREALTIRAFYLLSSDVQAAALDLERAVEVASSLGPIPLERARANLGLSLTVQGRLSEAEQAFSGAVQSLTELGVVRVLRHMLHNLGLVRHRLGRLEGATTAVRRALKLHEHLGQSVRAASTRLGLACIALDRGDLERAVRLAYETVAETGESERLVWARNEATALAAAGHLHLQQPESARAVLGDQRGPTAAFVRGFLELGEGRADAAIAELRTVVDDWKILGLSHHGPASVHAVLAVFEHARDGSGAARLELACSSLGEEDHTEALVVEAARHRIAGSPLSTTVPRNHLARLILATA